MTGIPEATPINLSVRSAASLKAWRVPRRRSTGCGSGRGLCCWRRPAWRAGPSVDRSDARPVPPRSGACATPNGGSRVSTRPASGALNRSTRRRRASASWRCWISRRRRATPAGPGHCWLRRSATSMSSMSGGSCARTRSIWPGANPGARATIPSLSPRPPMWSGSIWRRPRTRSSFASTRSPRSRRWSGRRAT